MKRLITILTFLIAGYSSQASHIVGGEFTMTYALKGYSYKLELDIYFDEEHALGLSLIDDEVLVHIYDKETDQLMDSYWLPLINANEFVEYINPDCQDHHLETRILHYERYIALDPTEYNNNDGYYVVFDRCCRNEVIKNIEDPGETGNAFYMEFPPISQNGSFVANSSPEFAPPFGEYACVGQPFYFNFSASDMDGDSLVYYMTDPFNGNQGLPYVDAAPVPHPAPYATVVWSSGYSATNAVPGTPAMDVDPQTGILSVTPSDSGIFVFSVIVEEYRDGNYLGQVKRDYQLLVRPPCDPNIAPTVLFYDEGSAAPYNPLTDTIFISESGIRTFDIAFTDSLVNGQPSIVSVTSEVFNGDPQLMWIGNSVGVINSPGDTSYAQLIWDDCADSEGDSWDVQLLCSDNGCVLPLYDTILVHFVVEEAINNDPFLYTSLSNDTVDLYIWNDTSFSVFGEDVDNDLITLSASGVGFSMSNVGMQFPTSSDSGMTDSDFYWYAECEDLDRKYFPVDFTVDDNWCGEPNDSTIRVMINVEETVYQEMPYTPPNVFTPNGDGINDYFEMSGLPIDRCGNEFLDIEVYNRWGARVFYDDSRLFSWDGGNVVQGIYYYHVHYENRSYRGWVQLLR